MTVTFAVVGVGGGRVVSRRVPWTSRAVVLTAVRLVGAHWARFTRAGARVVKVARPAYLCVTNRAS